MLKLILEPGAVVRALAAALLAVAFASPATAATLDFNGFGFNENPGAEVVLPEATITATLGDEVLRPFLVNGFCFENANGCAGSGAVVFTDTVENLVFSIFATAEGESTDIEIYGTLGLIASINVTVDGAVDLSSYGLIQSLVLSSNAAGVSGGTAFRDFAFDIVPVPEPGTLSRLMSALVAAGAIGRTKRIF